MYQQQQNKNFESFDKVQERGKKLEALMNLGQTIKQQEHRQLLLFNDFLHLASTDPEMVFRDIFRLFHDMVHFFIQQPTEKGSSLNKEIGFVDYNTEGLFVENCENPFFADRLFANRLINMISTLNKGLQSNRMYLFEGPAGSGKSTFLNNLLQKLEEYTKYPEGAMYSTHWSLDVKKLGGFKKVRDQVLENARDEDREKINDFFASEDLRDQQPHMDNLEINCPNHDHPILQIPVSYREQFLDELIDDEKLKEKIFNEKQYRWVLKEVPCTFCTSLFNQLMDSLDDPLEVFGMLKARVTNFRRQFGEGVSVFNPGDPLPDESIKTLKVQRHLNKLFNNQEIKYTYSYLAKTNNGVLAVMDIKDNNVERLKNLHGIISDGVHKVDLIEERIKTLFMGLVNPEDKQHFENIKSFQDRIITVKIPFVLDYRTEVKIYLNKFGENITRYFLPRVLDYFAKVIIASRLDKNTPTIKEWIDAPERYKFLDKDLFLLKMEIYAGETPTWLYEEDLDKLDRNTLKKIIGESEVEGQKGYSGRMSLNLFSTFFQQYAREDKPITMQNIRDFFLSVLDENILDYPGYFIDKLVEQYDYYLMQEIKEAIYYYNEKQISTDILNYLYAINFDPDTVKVSPYTGEELEINEEFFKNFEALYLGVNSTRYQRWIFRNKIRKEYITKTLAQEIRIENKDITETEQYKGLFKKYTKNLKANALAPYVSNENFRRALQDYHTKNFNSYDTAIQKDVKRLIGNLCKNYGYTEEGALNVTLYAVDNNLFKRF
jgi:predicted Ser/Thr protein kinase